MKSLGFLWFFLSVLFVGLGVALITVSSIGFILSTFAVLRITVGIIWTLGGSVMLFVAIKLIILERMRNTLAKRKRSSVR